MTQPSPGQPCLAARRRRIAVKILAWVAICAVALATFVALKLRYSHLACPPQVGFRGLAELGQVDVLLVGSSLTRMGYSPAIVEERLGGTAYVLAYNGLEPTYVQAVLATLFEGPSPRPKLLVLEGTALAFSLAPDLRDKNLFFNAPPALKKRLLDLLRQRPQGLPFGELYDLTVAAKNQDFVCHPLTSRLLAGMFHRGAHVAAPEHHLTPEQFAVIAPLPSDLLPLLPEQLARLAEIAALVRAAGVRTVFVNPAIPAPLAELPEVRQNQEQLRQAILAHGFAYIDGTQGFDNHDPRHYGDSRHFSRQGRDAFTHFAVDQWLATGLLP